MSKFTTEVRFICETSAGLDTSVGYMSVNDILEKCYKKVFDFDFPIFDEDYRPVLLKKILKHYYTREIGEETVGLWKLRLDARLNEIMPYYNKLYESELIDFDPMKDTDYWITGNSKGNETNNLIGKVTRDDVVTDTGKRQSDSNSKDGGKDTFHTEDANKNDHWDYYSDTPQGTVQNLKDLTYLTNARHITDDGSGSTSDSTSNYGRTNETKATTDTTNKSVLDGETNTDNKRTINTTEDYLRHVSGKFQGKSYSQLLQEYRDTLLNIDVMIINELSDLFFGLWE